VNTQEGKGGCLPIKNFDVLDLFRLSAAITFVMKVKNIERTCDMKTDKERLAMLEVKSENAEETLRSHSEQLDRMDRALTSLLGEVKQIRNALYIMAIGIAANIPALSNLLTSLKAILK